MGGPSSLVSLTVTSSRSLQRALKKPDTENKFPRGTSWLLRFLLRDAGSWLCFRLGPSWLWSVPAVPLRWCLSPRFQEPHLAVTELLQRPWERRGRAA